MTFRKVAFPLGMACVLATATAGVATAQSARFSDIDRDRNGSLSYNELVASFGQAGADRVWSRGDGSALSRSDARALSSRASDDDDDDGRRGRGFGGGRDDDDDDAGRDDDDDDGASGGDNDDDDDDGGSGGGGDDDDD